MFPIRDHNPSQRTPYVTYALIAANVTIFLLTLPLAADEVALRRLYFSWAMIPARISSGEGYETLVTAIFLHAGFLHIAGNMLFLWVFGDNLEDQLGHFGFLVFYLVAGVGANLAQLSVDPWSTIPTVGASGAIAGVMGGYLLLFPRARVDVLFIFFIFIRIFPVPAWAMLGFWFLLQLISGMGMDTSSGGVAYWAHAGGFVIGFVYVIPLWLRRGGAGYWRASSGHPPHPANVYRVNRTRVPIVRRRR